MFYITLAKENSKEANKKKSPRTHSYMFILFLRMAQGRSKEEAFVYAIK